MAVLSTLRHKPQKKKVSLLSTLRKYFLGSTKCKEEEKQPEYSDDVSVISFDDARDRAQLHHAKVSKQKKSASSKISATSGTQVLSHTDDNTLSCTEKASGKKTLPPLDQAYTEKARSLLDPTLSWEGLKKSQCPRNLFLTDTSLDGDKKPTQHSVEPKLIKVAEAPIKNRVPYVARAKHVELLQDDILPKDEQKKIFLIPIPAKIVKVAEAPIQNRVSFQSIWKANSTNNTKQQILKTLCLEPIKFAPASVKKQVRFQLTPSVEIIPSLHPKEVSFPPSAFSVMRQIVRSADRADFLTRQEAQTFRKTNQRVRPRAAHSRIRNTTMNVQEYIPYYQECDRSSY